jgi:hypothetical protein
MSPLFPLQAGTVLPGPEQAVPPFQQKYTAIWHKHTAISNFFKNSASFPLFHVIFLIITAKAKTELFSIFNSFIIIACLNIFGTKFRYFSATFG